MLDMELFWNLIYMFITGLVMGGYFGYEKGHRTALKKSKRYFSRRSDF